MKKKYGTLSLSVYLELKEDTPDRILEVCFGRIHFYLPKADMVKKSKYVWEISRTVSEEYLSRQYCIDTFVDYNLLSRHLKEGSLSVMIDGDFYAQYVFNGETWNTL